MPLSPPRIAFGRVRSLLQQMQQAPSQDALADTWELFLIYHHRTWSRCLGYYRGRGFWGALESKYSTRRSSEPLLQYVHQARHADEHGLQPIAQIRPGSTTISGGTIVGPSRIVGGNPAATVIAPGSTAKVIFSPATVVAGNVTNRGVVFAPPVIDGNLSPEVLRVAENAIKVYDDLFREIDLAGGD